MQQCFYDDSLSALRSLVRLPGTHHLKKILQMYQVILMKKGIIKNCIEYKQLVLVCIRPETVNKT